jgi:transcriptional regulator with XRE-family HTH domain
VTSPAKIGRIGDLYMELKDRELLVETMEEQGISARKLAAIAGWKSHTYLQRLLRGEVNTLTTDPALRIAHHLGLPVHRLFFTRVDTNAEHVGQKSGSSAA